MEESRPVLREKNLSIDFSDSNGLLRNPFDVAEHDGCSFPVFKNTIWTFRVSCTNCGTVNESPVDIDVEHEEDMPGSRGSANFIMKCKGCKRTVSIHHIASHLNLPKLEEIATKNKLTTDKLQGAFECRGCDIVEWKTGPGFITTSNSSQTEMSVDLSDGSWADVDENSESCFIDGPESEVVKVKV
ncbi:hypothetical protein GEMRC1_008482 [Eukaryota sp. GEM-RC1]